MSRPNSAAKPIQQHADVSLAGAVNVANTQNIVSSVDLDIEADLVAANSVAEVALRLPLLSVAIPGKGYQVKQLGAGVVRVTPVAGELIDGVASRVTAGEFKVMRFYAAMGLTTPQWLTGGTDGADDPAGTTTVNNAADFGIAVGGIITLIPDHLYKINQIINLGTDVLQGHNVTLIGSSALQSLLITNSPNALISSDADGYITLIGLFCSNAGGPFINFSMGATPLSFSFMDFVFFTGDPLNNGTGVGTIGTIDGADRIAWDACFFTGCVDGLKMGGTLGEISIMNSPFTSRATATSYVGVEVLASATTDIFSLANIRFTTNAVADRAVTFSPSSTNTAPMRLRSCTIRGPGTFIATASLQKTSPRLITSDCEGVTAPLDSQFSGNATFVGNAVETVIGAGNQGVLLPIGNGNDSHEIFNGDAFVERFTLLGSTAQTQSFRYDGLRPRTFKIELHCQLNRAGGGNITIGLGLAHDPISGGGPVVITRSVNETEVGNAASPGYTTMVLELAPGDKVLVRMSNNSGIANVIMNSANWAVSHT